MAIFISACCVVLLAIVAYLGWMGRQQQQFVRQLTVLHHGHSTESEDVSAATATPRSDCRAA